MAAALEGIGSFDGRSSLRTWLTSILRFKVIDLQRRAVKERSHVDIDEEPVADDESWMDDFFDETGHWRVAPQAWSVALYSSAGISRQARQNARKSRRRAWPPVSREAPYGRPLGG